MLKLAAAAERARAAAKRMAGLACIGAAGRRAGTVATAHAACAAADGCILQQLRDAAPLPFAGKLLRKIVKNLAVAARPTLSSVS